MKIKHLIALLGGLNKFKRTPSWQNMITWPLVLGGMNVCLSALVVGKTQVLSLVEKHTKLLPMDGEY